MAATFRVLGQTAPGGALVNAYTVPAATQTVVSTIVVCNRASTPNTFSIQVRVGGAASDVSQYLFYQVPIAGNQTVVLTAGLTLGAGDIVSVQSGGTGGLSYSLFGQEIT